MINSMRFPTGPEDKGMVVTKEFVKNSKNIPLIVSKFDVFLEKGVCKKPIIIDTAEAVTITPGQNNNYNADMQTASVEFAQKVIATSINVTGLVVNSSQNDLIGEVKERMPYRIYRKMQSEAFGKGNANGDNGLFQSILDYNNATVKVAGLKIAEFTDVTEMFSDYTKTNGSLDGAILVVDTHAKAIKLNAGGLEVFKGMQGTQGIIGTVHGVPVMVQDMNKKADMVLMSTNAYGVSVDRDVIVVNEISGDTGTASKDFKFISSKLYADGKVLNPLGIKIYKASV